MKFIDGKDAIQACDKRSKGKDDAGRTGVPAHKLNAYEQDEIVLVDSTTQEKLVYRKKDLSHDELEKKHIFPQ